MSLRNLKANPCRKNDRVHNELGAVTKAKKTKDKNSSYYGYYKDGSTEICSQCKRLKKPGLFVTERVKVLKGGIR